MASDYKEKMQARYGESKTVLSKGIDKYKMAVFETNHYDKKCLCLECNTMKDISDRRVSEIRCDNCGAEASGEEIFQSPTQTRSKNGSAISHAIIPKRRMLFTSEKDGVTTKTEDVFLYDEILFYHDSERTFTKELRESQIYDVSGNVPSNKRITSVVRERNGKLVSESAGFNAFGNEGHAPGYTSVSYYQGATHYACHSDVDKSVLNDRTREADNLEKNIIRTKYNAICRDRYGLPDGKDVPFATAMALTEFAVQYPAVMEYEVGKFDVNRQFAIGREPDGPMVSDRYAAERKIEVITDVMDTIAECDYKLSFDLRQAKTAEQVEDKLREVTFRTVDTDKEHIGKIDAKESDENKALVGKILKKEFAKNPYAAASNARTLQKLNITDHNFIKKAFDVVHSENSHGWVRHGVLKPIETQQEMQFMKLYANTHIPGAPVTDIYGSDKFTPESFGKCCHVLKMMNSKNVKIADTKEKVADSLNCEAVRRLQRYFRNNGIEASVPNVFYHRWDDKTDTIVSKVKSLSEFGSDTVYYGGTDGKPVFPNRNPAEIAHVFETLETRIKSLDSSDKTPKDAIPYSDEKIAKFNKRIHTDEGDYKFSLIADHDEFVVSAAEMHICHAQGPHYENGCRNGSHTMVLMTNMDDYRYVGLMQLDNNNRLMEMKSYGDGSICDKNEDGSIRCGLGAEKALRQYISDMGIDVESITKGHDDYNGVGNSNYYPYNKVDIRYSNIPVTPLPDADAFIRFLDSRISQAEAMRTAQMTSELLTENPTNQMQA